MPYYLTKCTASTARGKPCRAWAVTNSVPALCSAHSGRSKGAGAPAGNQNRRTHGFYSTTYTAADQADLVALAIQDDILDELGAVRVHLRRLLAYLAERDEAGTVSASLLASVSPLVTQSANTIANLQRTQQLLAGDGAGIVQAFADALDIVGPNLGVEL